MKLKITLFITIFSCLNVFSQSPEYYTYNPLGGVICHFVKTHDHGMAIITNWYAPIIIRTDSNGSILWQKKITYDYIGEGYELAETTDGGIVVTSTNSFGRLLLIKLSSTGSLLWANNYNGYYFDMCIVATPDNGQLFTGTNSGCDGNFLVKTDSSGQIEWRKYYTNSINNTISSRKVIIDQLGNFVICGQAYSDTTSKFYTYLMSVSPSGTMNWYFEYDFGIRSYPYSVIANNAGGFSIIGDNSLSDTTYQPFLLVTNAFGTPLWVKTYVTNNPWTSGNDLIQLSSDDYILCGHTIYPEPILQEGFIFKLNSKGDIIWSLSEGNFNYNSNGSDYFFEIEKDHDDWYYLSGGYNDGSVMWHLNDSTGFCHATRENLTVRSDTIIVNSKTIIEEQIYETVMPFSATLTNQNWQKKLICPADTTFSSVNNYNNKDNVLIHPNPFSIETVVTSSINLENATLSISNTLGQEVKVIRNISGNSVKLDRDNLPNGIYLIRLTCENKVVATGKFVLIY